jgi:hypothetical protein
VPVKFVTALGCGLLALALVCPGAPARAGEGSANLLRGEYLRLKERFEALAQKNSDPRILSCLAMETVALSWTMTAAQLTEDKDARQEWRRKATGFEASWRESRNWEARQLAALDVYYDALRELALYLVTQNQRLPLISALTEIQNQTRDRLAALSGQNDIGLEKRVVLSGALVSLASVTVRSLGGAPMEQPVNVILNNLTLKIEETNQRIDLHYRAKMTLLYTANIKGLTALIFLLGQNAGPPLSGELAIIHRSLNQYGQDHNLPYANSLTWVAQAQATLPLAYWLATH